MLSLVNKKNNCKIGKEASLIQSFKIQDKEFDLIKNFIDTNNNYQLTLIDKNTKESKILKDNVIVAFKILYYYFKENDNKMANWQTIIDFANNLLKANKIQPLRIGQTITINQVVSTLSQKNVKYLKDFIINTFKYEKVMINIKDFQMLEFVILSNVNLV